MEGSQSRGGKVLVYGAGNVAFSLVPALQAVFGVGGVEVYSRSERSAEALGKAYGACWHCEEWRPGVEYSLCVVAVPDGAVRSSVLQLDIAGRLVVHTSGSVPLESLREGRGGVLYPLQSFVKGERCDLREVPLYVEGQDGDTYREVQALASQLSNRVRTLDSDTRERLHVGGVVVNNFVYRLLALVQELCSDGGGIDVSDYSALIATTIKRGLSNDGGSRQTGPARRKDLETITAHLQLIQRMYPHLLGPYIAMTDNILSSLGEEHGKKGE